MRENNLQTTFLTPKTNLVSTNKLAPEDRAIHNWYRFVLSFPPHLVRTYLERFGADSSTLVLDPFCGTGTTLVECQKLGIPTIGIEAHPMSCFASKVKVDWQVDPENLLAHAHTIAAKTEDEYSATNISDSFFSITNHDNIQMRHLPTEQQPLLIRHSISPLPLHKTLVLLDVLNQDRQTHYYQYERLALAKAVVSHISNVYFGPEVGVGKIKEDAAVLEPWLDSVHTMVKDLRAMQDKPMSLSPLVIQSDSRSIHQSISPDSVDFVITSPPYPNEKDYTRTNRLESVLLGFVRNKTELRAIKRSLIRSNTRTVYKDDQDDTHIAHHSEIQQLADSIESRRVELGKTSGFERLYARTTRLYFGGLYQHLAHLRFILRNGAKLAYVVGDQASFFQIPIRTGQILANIAESLGYEVEGIDLFRTRRSTATGQHLREEIVMLKWRK